MNVYESIMQGLTEAVDYQQGKINARKTHLTIKPVDTFNNNDIKQIRQRTGLSQVMFAGSLGSLPKQWKHGKTAEINRKELLAACLRLFGMSLSF